MTEIGKCPERFLRKKSCPVVETCRAIRKDPQCFSRPVGSILKWVPLGGELHQQNPNNCLPEWHSFPWPRSLFGSPKTERKNKVSRLSQPLWDFYSLVQFKKKKLLTGGMTCWRRAWIFFYIVFNDSSYESRLVDTAALRVSTPLKLFFNMTRLLILLMLALIDSKFKPWVTLPKAKIWGCLSLLANCKKCVVVFSLFPVMV